MKKICKVFLLCSSLLVAFSANAWSLSYPVSAGEEIKMYANNTGAEYEGFYQFKTKSGSTYGTFCLELNEYFYSGSTYTVKNIESYAEAGGVGGPSPDPISDATKWLFWHFMSKDILAVTGKDENDYSMQLAIWMLEGELVAGKTDAYLAQYNNDPTAKVYFEKAIASGTAGSAYDVMVMNLIDKNGNAQSQLVAPVPEPSTLFLLGAGLAGFAIWRRKKSA